jgi:hypothetical protein
MYGQQGSVASNHLSTHCACDALVAQSQGMRARLKVIEGGVKK